MWIGVISYILVVVVVFGRALLPPEGFMIFGDDIHRQYYFFREFFNTWIRQGVFPWWNPYLFGGEPFIANPVVNIWYPPNWLFIVLPLNIAYSWHLATHVVWAMVGMKRMIREIRGIGEIGGWISGLIFGFSGFFMARTFAGHVDVIAAASWMPWVVWAFYALARAEAGKFAPGDKNFLGTAMRFHPAKILSPVALNIASMVFAMQLLAGYQTMAFMTVIIVGFVTLLLSYFERSWKPIVRVGLGGLGGVGLAAFHLLPVAEFFRASIRTYSLPYSWHSYGAIEWRSLLQLLNPFQFGNQYTYSGPPPNFIEHSSFIGIGGLVLSLIGIVFLGSKVLRSLRLLKKSNKTIVILGGSFFLVALFGLWVALGPNAPVDFQYILWKYVPMYHYLRIPSRHLILVVFGMAGLAGIGFQVVLNRLPRSLRLPIAGIMTVVIVGEMIWFGRGFIELKPVPEARHDKELIALLQRDKEPYRILQNFGVWVPERDVLDFDSVMSYGIFSATGYDPSILRSYFEYVSKGDGANTMLSHDVQVPYITDPEILDRLNVKHIMVPLSHDPFQSNKRYRLVYEKGLRVYENTTVKPRFYLNDPCGNVTIRSYTPNRITLGYESACDTQLASSEVWYPGWEAYIDGEKTHIDKSNDTFRTLFVPVGNHTVEYRYQPRIFLFGAVLSVLTATILLLMVFIKRKPKRS
ncbi:MAG TPA: YfhO family protein [Patescibacteria group bacterium]|nr:YfhO family protein [Patescibacteria group bacterium]